MEPLGWALLGVLGAWSALDGVSMGQFMVSRPLVTGVLTGMVLGDPYPGFVVGLFLEVVHLGTVPAGGARLPEPGPAAIPATVAALLLGGSGGLAAGAALGVVFARLGGASMVAQRRWQGRLVQGLEEGGVDARELNRRLGIALALDGARGTLLALGGIALAHVLPVSWAGLWPLSTPETLGLLAVLSALPAGLLVVSMAGSRHRVSLLASGVLLGIVLGFWTSGG